jgi:S-DNA-T family DNA segregation ATPase FtsK/SpoIIIE
VPNEQRTTRECWQNIYKLDKVFKPYVANLEWREATYSWRDLNHLEVEKNAVPESLSLLEQYEVKK